MCGVRLRGMRLRANGRGYIESMALTRFATSAVLVLMVACGGVSEPAGEADTAPCPSSSVVVVEREAGAVDAANVVDECVSNVHSDFLCARADLPQAFTAVGCSGTPKKMHVESGTLISRPDGRLGCVDRDIFGERATCCEECGPGRVVTLTGCGPR